MTTAAIPLECVQYDSLARKGFYCTHPYKDHPKGCPNFPKCIQKRPDFETIALHYHWYAVVEEFDLKAHAAKMKDKHPDWTDRHCRNLCYWQGGVRKRLREKAEAMKGDIILDIPEACGVEVFETMKMVGVILEKKPDMVKKIMLVGFRVK